MYTNTFLTHWFWGIIFIHNDVQPKIALSFPLLLSLEGNRRENHVYYMSVEGYAVVQLVEALCCKPEGHRFNSVWGYGTFSST